jgi:hypothetical protein
MVKIDETKGCDQRATFYVKANLTTLITTRTSSTNQPSLYILFDFNVIFVLASSSSTLSGWSCQRMSWASS